MSTLESKELNQGGGPMESQGPRPNTKLPQLVFDPNTSIYRFPPNRETLGGTAYFVGDQVVSATDTPGDAPIKNNILVDCPAWNDANIEFLVQQGGVRWLVITHRGGSSQVRNWQAKFGCDVVLQEQEAYLLPQVDTRTFHRELALTPQHRLLWTPGHSPGSLCFYSAARGGILFTGRHLLPSRQGGVMPLRVSKTFHWPRQLQQIQRLLDEFAPQTLSYICPGANTGFLRGERYIERAYEQLASLDLSALARSKALL